MPGFTLTQKALADLKEIGRYTQEEWGRQQRGIYLAMLDTCFQHLADDPLKGKDCSEIRIGYRQSVAGSHIIFYRKVSEGAIEIVRILHGSMDVNARISEP